MSMEDEEIAASFVKWIVYGFIACLLLGALVLAWMNILGPAFNQLDYNLFNNSAQHTNAVAQKFSDDCLQLAQARDTTTRKAIEQDIYQVSSTVDLSKIQMPDATRQCVQKAIYDVTH